MEILWISKKCWEQLHHRPHLKKKTKLHRKFTRVAVAYVLGCHENVNST